MSRAVLVTGGSRGIGAAIARAFAERGDRVAVHCRDAVGAAEAVRDSLDGDGHVVVRADLADPAEVRAMVDAAAAGLGGLDVLVNNAGVYLGHPVLGTSYEEWQAAWQATLGVNLVGAANVTWCAVQHMTASGQPERADRQRRVARRVPGRADASGLRGEQGRAARLRPVAGGGAGAARDHRGLGRPGVRGDRHDRGRARDGGRRRHPGAVARSAGSRRPTRSRPRSCTSRRPKRSGQAAPSST